MVTRDEAEEDGPPNYARLNATFYSGDPAAYFERRLGLLLLAAARRDEVNALMADGLTYGGVRFRPTQADDAEQAAKDHESTLLAESLVLLHHSSEALLRLFIAHGEERQCPWLGTARLKDFREFKKVLSILGQEDWPDWIEALICPIFMGSAPGADDPRLAELRQATKELLSFLASELLKDSPVYNAAKHGMAVLPGVRSTSIEDPVDGTGIFTNGPSLLFLETAWDDKNKERTYSEVVRWMTPARNLWLAQVVVQQMRALWTVAQARYAGGTAESVEVVDPGWQDKMWSDENGPSGGFHRTAFVVATEVTLPPDAGQG